jgi:hypothetical protein
VQVLELLQLRSIKIKYRRSLSHGQIKIAANKALFAAHSLQDPAANGVKSSCDHFPEHPRGALVNQSHAKVTTSLLEFEPTRTRSDLVAAQALAARPKANGT